MTSNVWMGAKHKEGASGFPLSGIKSFTGPSGATVITAAGSSWVNESMLRIDFPTQSATGVYSLVLDSQIQDVNGIAWVLGATNSSTNAIGLLPVSDNTTDPDYFIYTYNRSDIASANASKISVEYGSALRGWTEALDSDPDVIIEVTDNPVIDNVVIKIKRTLTVGGKLFTRLKVEITE